MKELCLPKVGYNTAQEPASSEFYIPWCSADENCRTLPNSSGFDDLRVPPQPFGIASMVHGLFCTTNFLKDSAVNDACENVVKVTKRMIYTYEMWWLRSCSA